MNANTKKQKTKQRFTVQELVQRISEYLAKAMKIGLQDIAIDVEFSQLDFDSALALKMTADLEDLLGRPLSPTLAYNYPTIEKLAAHLAEGSDS